MLYQPLTKIQIVFEQYINRQRPISILISSFTHPRDGNIGNLSFPDMMNNLLTVVKINVTIDKILELQY